MKGFRPLLCFLAALLGGQLLFSQSQILVHLEPGTPQDTVDAYLTDLQALELAKTPLSEVRLWEVPDTLIKGTDTIYAAEKPSRSQCCHE